MDKTIIVKRLEKTVSNAADAVAALDKAHIPFNKIDTVNWNEFPYKPEVEFRAAHTGDSLILNYRVTEEAVRAAAQTDNGLVWEDSCVEFFVTFDDKKYQNIECNCTGTILSAVGPDRDHRELAPTELLAAVQRHSSLKADSLPAEGPVSWEVSLIVPVETFFASGLKSLSGVKARCNFYKCGDKLPTPHFLSWNPIRVANPDFHRPEYFGNIEFE